MNAINSNHNTEKFIRWQKLTSDQQISMLQNINKITMFSTGKPIV